VLVNRFITFFSYLSVLNFELCRIPTKELALAVASIALKYFKSIVNKDIKVKEAKEMGLLRTTLKKHIQAVKENLSQ
jgi:hypothetical protein